MTFDYIVNPETQRKVSIFSTKGRSILRNYLKVQNAGAGVTECKGKPQNDCPDPPCRWTPSREAKGRKRKDGTVGQPYEVKAHCRKSPGRSGSPKPKRPPSHCAGDVRPPCPPGCDEYDYKDRKTGAIEKRCRIQRVKSKPTSSYCSGKVPPCPDGCVKYNYKNRKTGAIEERCKKSNRPHYRHLASDFGHIDVSDSDSHSHEHHPHHVGRPAEYPHGGSPRYYY